jgi:hypothetical protein
MPPIAEKEGHIAIAFSVRVSVHSLAGCISLTVKDIPFIFLGGNTYIRDFFSSDFAQVLYPDMVAILNLVSGR